MRDERAGIQDHGVPAAVEVESEIQDRQARLGCDRHAHRVVDLQFVRANDGFLVQEKRREFA